MSAQVRDLTCWRGALKRRTWVSWWTAGHPGARSVPCWPERPMVSWGALKRECSTLVRLHLEYVSSSWLLSSRNEDILQMSELCNILYIPATDEWVKTVFYKCSLFWIHIRNNHKKKRLSVEVLQLSVTFQESKCQKYHWGMWPILNSGSKMFPHPLTGSALRRIKKSMHDFAAIQRSKITS